MIVGRHDTHDSRDFAVPVVLVSPLLFPLTNSWSCGTPAMEWNAWNWKFTAGQWEPLPELQHWERSSGWSNDDSAYSEWQYVTSERRKKERTKTRHTGLRGYAVEGPEAYCSGHALGQQQADSDERTSDGSGDIDMTQGTNSGTFITRKREEDRRLRRCEQPRL